MRSIANLEPFTFSYSNENILIDFVYIFATFVYISAWFVYIFGNIWIFQLFESFWVLTLDPQFRNTLYVNWDRYHMYVNFPHFDTAVHCGSMPKKAGRSVSVWEENQGDENRNVWSFLCNSHWFWHKVIFFWQLSPLIEKKVLNKTRTLALYNLWALFRSKVIRIRHKWPSRPRKTIKTADIQSKVLLSRPKKRV